LRALNGSVTRKLKLTFEAAGAEAVAVVDLVSAIA
jgi:hypothetical protein